MAVAGGAIMPIADLGAKRIDAFLLLLRTIENKGVTGDRAYYRAFGKNHYFTKTSDHPRQFYTGWNGQHSTAAGAYGITKETYDWAKAKAHVSDFSPASQDQIARWMILPLRCGLLYRAGRLPSRIRHAQGAVVFVARRSFAIDHAK